MTNPFRAINVNLTTQRLFQMLESEPPADSKAYTGWLNKFHTAAAWQNIAIKERDAVSPQWSSLLKTHPMENFAETGGLNLDEVMSDAENTLPKPLAGYDGGLYSLSNALDAYPEVRNHVMGLENPAMENTAPEKISPKNLHSMQQHKQFLAHLKEDDEKLHPIIQELGHNQESAGHYNRFLNNMDGFINEYQEFKDLSPLDPQYRRFSQRFKALLAHSNVKAKLKHMLPTLEYLKSETSPYNKPRLASLFGKDTGADFMDIADRGTAFIKKAYPENA